jgi:hypothetical protein
MCKSRTIETFFSAEGTEFCTRRYRAWALEHPHTLALLLFNFPGSSLTAPPEHPKKIKGAKALRLLRPLSIVPQSF